MTTGIQSTNERVPTWKRLLSWLRMCDAALADDPANATTRCPGGKSTSKMLVLIR